MYVPANTPTNVTSSPAAVMTLTFPATPTYSMHDPLELIPGVVKVAGGVGVP